MRRHCIISGTGRTGTTFLVRLLTRLGFDTGFSIDNMVIDEIACAGLELDLRKEDAPYIVKSPWICTYIHELRDDIIIDAAIIPLRSLLHAAESRRRVQCAHHTLTEVPGGLWRVQDPADQEAELASQFFNLIYHLTLRDTKITFLHFPRLVRDSTYLYTGLSNVLPMPDRADFESAFAHEVAPHLVHFG